MYDYYSGLFNALYQNNSQVNSQEHEKMKQKYTIEGPGNPNPIGNKDKESLWRT